MSALRDSSLLAVEHHCANNLGGDLAALLGNSESEHGTYKNHFHGAPAAATVVPRHVPQPTAFGVQSATVVGLSDEPVESERDHRVKARFSCQDASMGAAGEHAGDFPELAPGTWVHMPTIPRTQVQAGTGSRGQSGGSSASPNTPNAAQQRTARFKTLSNKVLGVMGEHMDVAFTRDTYFSSLFLRQFPTLRL